MSDTTAEQIHEFDLPMSIGGGVLRVRELGMAEYEKVTKQASKALPRDNEGNPSMGEMFATMGAERRRLMRVTCVHSVDDDMAWSHEHGPEGFIESYGIKFSHILDACINLIHELSEEEESGFKSSHRRPGGRPAQSILSGRESAA